MEQINHQLINMATVGQNDYEELKRINDDPETHPKMIRIIQECRTYYDNLADLRKRRRRNRNFYRGKQWNDVVEDNGELTTEEELILKQGKQPLKNNQIRQIVKSLLGQYRASDYKPIVYSSKRDDRLSGEIMTVALRANLRDNETDEIDVRIVEEFALAGIISWKNYADWIPRRQCNDIVIDPKTLPTMFWNSDIRDIRGKDMHTIGEIHDLFVEEVISIFADNKDEAKTIREFYGRHDKSRRENVSEPQGAASRDMIDFLQPVEGEKVRVIEVWRKELETIAYVHDWATGEYIETDLTEVEVDEENMNRMEQADLMGIPNPAMMEYEEKQEEVWKYYFLTPNGHVLAHDRSPYWHKEHPYTIRMYPLVDGEIFGFVEDIIDQQKHINRLITLQDFMIGSAAKGVAFYPTSMIPDGWTEDDIADEYVKFNGMIFYDPSKAKTDGNHKPFQITGNAQMAGVNELLSLQLKLLQEISGVNEAMQGMKPPSGTPASLYAQQTTNSAINNKDFFEFFFSARRQRDLKVVQLIQQTYDEEKFINVSGEEYREQAKRYDPKRVRDVNFDLVLTQGSNNPVYQQVNDEYLFKFWEAGGIDLETLLENSSLPFGERLLESIKNKKEQLEQSGGQTNPQFLEAINGQQGVS
jgi:hypothetical protein